MPPATFEEKIERMRRKWPTIAEAANHPLTEHFLNKRRKTPWPIYVAVVLLCIFAFLVLISPPAFRNAVEDIFFVAVFGVVITNFIWNRRRPKTFYYFRDLFAANNLEKLHDIRLTPLTSRDILGIEAGLIVLKESRAFDRTATAILVGVLCLGFFSMPFAASDRVFSTSDRLFVSLALILLSFTIARYVSSDGVLIRSQLTHLSLQIVSLHAQASGSYLKYLENWPKALGIGFSIVLLITVYFSMAANAEPILSSIIIILLSICGLMLHLTRDNERTERVFEKDVERMSQAYNDLGVMLEKKTS